MKEEPTKRQRESASCLRGVEGVPWWVLAERLGSAHAAARVLFDTGQGLALLHNARELGIPLKDADAVVLSHGHYDHTGGLAMHRNEVMKTLNVLLANKQVEPVVVDGCTCYVPLRPSSRKG